MTSEIIDDGDGVDQDSQVMESPRISDLDSSTPLESGWTFWHDRKTSDKQSTYMHLQSLRQLGTFKTVEGFYQHYSYMLKPGELPRDRNIYCFREGYLPMWEEFPDGGCWIIRIKRKAALHVASRMWEHLLLACIGEAFDMPDVVGCVLSTRIKDDAISVWNKSNANKNIRFQIGEKLSELLDLDSHALIQYKDNAQSLQDFSTYRNAKNYMFEHEAEDAPVDTNVEDQEWMGMEANGLPLAAMEPFAWQQSREDDLWGANYDSAEGLGQISHVDLGHKEFYFGRSIVNSSVPAAELSQSTSGAGTLSDIDSSLPTSSEVCIEWNSAELACDRVLGALGVSPLASTVDFKPEGQFSQPLSVEPDSNMESSLSANAPAFEPRGMSADAAVFLPQLQ